MTTSSQKEFAQFFRLNRLLWSVRLEAFAALIHSIELILSSPAHFIVLATILTTESIE
jgi:hypothetical protein